MNPTPGERFVAASRRLLSAYYGMTRVELRLVAAQLQYGNCDETAFRFIQEQLPDFDIVAWYLHRTRTDAQRRAFLIEGAARAWALIRASDEGTMEPCHWTEVGTTHCGCQRCTAYWREKLANV